MALSGGERAQRIYDAIEAANPTLKGDTVSDAERTHVLAQITAMFGADTSYLVEKTVVNPLRGTAAAGATVQVAVPAGSGSVTSPASVTTNQGTIS